MRDVIRVTGFAAAAMLSFGAVVASRAMAQAPDQPTNLKYFPKSTSTQDLIQTMRGFCFSLGVRCQYCHAAKAGGAAEDLDYASDEKPTKVTARAMLVMVEGINRDYIAKLGATEAIRVQCVTCHHGMPVPKTMNALLAETIEQKDVAAAVVKYRELRSQRLGDGAYDFSETPLNILTESLLRQKKGKEAAAIMELNVEVNTPPSTWALHLLAQAHVLNQEPDKAKADYEKILQINPQDQFAKTQLEALKRQKPSM